MPDAIEQRSSEMTAVTVTIAETRGPNFAPAKVWMTTVVLSRKEARLVRDELERAFLDVPEELWPAGYNIEERAGRHSWGADGGPFYEIAIFLAQSTTDGFIAATAIKVFEKLIQKHRVRNELPGNDFWIYDYDRENIIEFAKWVIVSRYARLAEGVEDSIPGLDDNLELISETHNQEDGTWFVVLRDSWGFTYRVRFGIISGFPMAQTIEREAPSRNAEDE